MKYIISKKKNGFSLIELLVVVFVFSLVILATTGLFISAIRYQKKFFLQQELLNQSSYVVEYFGRALRMAKKDESGSCLSSNLIGKSYEITRNGFGIKFINHSNNDICQEFYLDLNDKTIKEIKNGGLAIPLISNNFEVSKFKIKFASGVFQPRITIFIEIQAKGRDNEIKKQIQTTISQRNLDV